MAVSERMPSVSSLTTWPLRESDPMTRMLTARPSKEWSVGPSGRSPPIMVSMGLTPIFPWRL